jgi:hypothetical protein
MKTDAITAPKNSANQAAISKPEAIAAMPVSSDVAAQSEAVTITLPKTQGADPSLRDLTAADQTLNSLLQNITSEGVEGAHTKLDSARVLKLLQSED